MYKRFLLALLGLACAGGAVTVFLLPQHGKNPPAGVSPAVAESLELVIPQVTALPTIDGDLSDPVWQQAAPTGPFCLTMRPGRVAPKQATRACVLFTSEAICFGFECDDADLASSPRAHDGNVWEDDSVEIFLSPAFEGSETFHFVVNLDGVRYDAKGVDASWTPAVPWAAAVRKRAGGWTVEIAIPFKSFLPQDRLPRRGDLWGLKLAREDYVKPKTPLEEVASWTLAERGLPDEGAFGELVFVSRNLLLNGGAEIDRDGLPTEWIFSSGGKYIDKPENVRVDPGVKVEGKQSCRVSFRGYFSVEPKSVALRRGKTYRASARIRFKPEGDAAASFNIVWNRNLVALTPSDDFKLYELYYTDDNTGGACGFVALGGNGTLWIDDARLEEVRQVDPAKLPCTSARLLAGSYYDPKAPRSSVMNEPEIRQVPLNVNLPAGLAAGVWPVTFGVPVPRGQLRSPDRVRILDGQGREVPAQISATGQWDREGGVKWLLVDCSIDAARAQGYRLEFGTKVARRATKGITLDRQTDGLMIDTGAIRTHIPSAGPAWFDQVWLNGTPMLAAGTPAGPYQVDQNGKRYRAKTTAPLVVEEDGPLRVVVRCDGWYIADDGTRLNRAITRLVAFAGQPYLKVFHTWVMTGSSDEYQFKEWAITVPVAATGALRTAIMPDAALDLGKLVQRPVGAAPIRISIDNASRHVLKSVLTEGATILSEGGRIGNWFDLSGPDGGITIVCQEAWQQFPKAYEARADGEAILHLWGARDRPMDLRTKAILAGYKYDPGTLEYWDKYEFESAGKQGFGAGRAADIPANGMGVAKTHELAFRFHGGDFLPAEANTFARSVDEPVLVMADPAWNCATEVIGPLHPYDPPRFPEVERKLEAMFDALAFQCEIFSDYGIWDWVDIHQAYFGGGTAPEKGNASPGAWRHWTGIHYGWQTDAWTLYFRSGQRKYYRYGVAAARHMMDVAMCHVDNAALRKVKGGHYYEDYSLIHWNNDSRLLGVETWYRFLPLYHHLAGYQRARDVFEEWGESVHRYDSNPALQDWGYNRNMPGSGGRILGANLNAMLELYSLTLERRYLDIATKWQCWLIDHQLPGGAVLYCLGFPEITVAHWNYIIPSWADYAVITGSPAARDGLLRLCQARTWLCPDVDSHIIFYDQGYGFLISGDPDFLDAGAVRLRRLLQPIAVSDNPYLAGKGPWPFKTIYVWAIRDIPMLMEAMARAPAAWQARNLPFRLAEPVVDGAESLAFRKTAAGAERIVVRALGGSEHELARRDGQPAPGIDYALVRPDGKTMTGKMPPGKFELVLPADAPAGDYLLRGGKMTLISRSSNE